MAKGQRSKGAKGQRSKGAKGQRGRGGRVHLATATREDRVHLAVSLAGSGMTVDREKGLLCNVPFITKGEAIGHGFMVDDVMLQQVVAGIKAPGVKSRLTHPKEHLIDGVMVLLGRASNPRIEGDQVRGEITFGKYAEITPFGNLKEYILEIADKDPDLIGLSIVFDMDWAAVDKILEDENIRVPPGRIKEMWAVDVVGDPGANPGGMLDRGHSRSGAVRPAGGKRSWAMNEALKKYLISIGMKAAATDADAAKFYEALEGDQREIAEGLYTPGIAEGEAQGAEGEGKPKAEAKPKAEGGQPKAEGEAAPTPAAAEEKEIAAIRKGQQMERGRVAAIKKLSTDLRLGAAWELEMIDSGVGVDEVRRRALMRVAANMSALPADRAGQVQVGDDLNRSTLAVALTDAVMVRAGSRLYQHDPLTRRTAVEADGRPKRRDPHGRAAQFVHMSLFDMGRAWLRELGVPGVETLPRRTIIDCMMSGMELRRNFGHIALAQSTSDFDYILQDAMGKSLRAAYVEAQKTWVVWCRRATAPDFKDIKRASLSEAPGLTARPEGGEIMYGTIANGREQYALVEYAGGLKLTRQAIINDDLDAFSRLPRMQADAAARKEDDVAYAILTANADLADGIDLFHADHGNFVDNGSGAVPSEATLNAGRAAMRLQKGPNSAATLNLVPAFLIAPAALEGTVKKLLTSEADPAATMGHATNIWRGQLTPVIEPRLDADDPAAWYLSANPDQIDTVEVCFLEGEPEPQLSQETEFGTGDKKFAVTHVVAAKALDPRGLYFNDGN